MNEAVAKACRAFIPCQHLADAIVLAVDQHTGLVIGAMQVDQPLHLDDRLHVRAFEHALQHGGRRYILGLLVRIKEPAPHRLHLLGVREADNTQLAEVARLAGYGAVVSDADPRILGIEQQRRLRQHR